MVERSVSGVRLTWLGQADFLLEFAETRLLVDPFLSSHEARLFPAPEISSLGRVDWLPVTHDHVDHLDLEGKRVDIALLPINGRDFFREERGIVGNLNAREAVELASRVGARILVPMHWDLFAGNTEQPSVVLDEVGRTGARLHVPTLDRLRSFELL